MKKIIIIIFFIIRKNCLKALLEKCTNSDPLLVLRRPTHLRQPYAFLEEVSLIKEGLQEVKLNMACRKK